MDSQRKGTSPLFYTPFDPSSFDTIPNVYTEAATRRLWLEVTAKPTLKDGRIKALYIMDAKIIEDL